MVRRAAASHPTEPEMPANGAITAMLAGVTGPEEAEIALAGGADIIHLSDGGSAALPLERIAVIVAAVAGRRRISATVEPLRENPDFAIEAAETLAATSVDGIMVPVRLDAWDAGTIRAIAAAASSTQLIAVLFADREGDLLSPVAELAAAGFNGLMLDIADRSGDRLVARLDAGVLATFVATAREHNLLVGMAGSLEAPDVPRLLALRPDFLGFRSALRTSQDPDADIDIAAVRSIRALIPLKEPEIQAGVDEPLPAARARLERKGGQDIMDRVFVRDFVLPVWIGAYKYEHAAPQNVRFDVSVEVQRARGASQGLAQIFSYDLLTDGIRAIVAEGHIDLVESLADRIAALALSHRRAKRVTVRVEKLDRGPGGVGVEIVVERPGTEAAVQALLATLEESAPKARS